MGVAPNLILRVYTEFQSECAIPTSRGAGTLFIFLSRTLVWPQIGTTGSSRDNGSSVHFEGVQKGTDSGLRGC